MNLELSQREKRSLCTALQRIVFDHPEFTGIQTLLNNLKTAIKETEDWKIGNKYLEEAVTHGFDDGYASASDYYFAVVYDTLHDQNGHKLSRKFIELILCFKFNWYFNGQSFRIHDDGSFPRNFSDFFGENKKWIERVRDQNWGDTEEDAFDLRQVLLNAGMEEKPELVDLWKEACAAAREKRKCINHED